MALSVAHETRAIIKFCCELGYSPTKTYEMLQTTTSRKNISRTQIFEWHRRFREGRESVRDNEGKGRKSIVDSVMVASVETAVKRDRRVTMKELCGEKGYSYGMVHRILTENLNMCKVSARWIPRILTDTHREVSFLQW